MGTNVYFSITSMRERLLGGIPPEPDLTAGPFWEKTFYDLIVPDDIYDWMERIMVPVIWQNRTTTGAQFYYGSGSSILLGQLRIRTTRVRAPDLLPREPATRSFGPPCHWYRQEGASGR